MKRVVLLITAVALSTFTFAGTNGLKSLQEKTNEAREAKEIISKGFYLNLGVAFPTLSSSSGSTGTFSLGIQPNIEIGNQWYFYTAEKWGIGMKISWFQFGFSATDYFGSTLSTIDMRFIKISPQFTYAITPDMAIDATFELAPTLLLLAFTGNSSTTVSNTSGSAAAGLLFAPGVRFRYKIFAAGFDISFGSLSSLSVSSSGAGSGSANMVSPRVYLGFKF